MASPLLQRVESYEYELPADFEDEEIDEDEAFNSEDERMYGHLFAKRKGGGGGGDSESEDEDSDEDEGGSDDDLLDSGEDDDSEVEGSEEEESGESEEEEDEVDDIFGQAGGLADSDDQAEGSSDDDLAEGKSEDEGDAEAHEAMVRAVTGGVADAKRAKQRKRDVVVTEAFPESEFNLPAAGKSRELFTVSTATSVSAVYLSHFPLCMSCLSPICARSTFP